MRTLVASHDTVNTPMGLIDVPRTLALWTTVYKGPADLVREGQWVDRASVGIPLHYVLIGYYLGNALIQRGDRAAGEPVLHTVDLMAKPPASSGQQEAPDRWSGRYRAPGQGRLDQLRDALVVSTTKRLEWRADTPSRESDDVERRFDTRHAECSNDITPQGNEQRLCGCGIGVPSTACRFEERQAEPRRKQSNREDTPPRARSQCGMQRRPIPSQYRKVRRLCGQKAPQPRRITRAVLHADDVWMGGQLAHHRCR